MLAGMSSTEYADWHRFYSTHYLRCSAGYALFRADVHRAQPVFQRSIRWISALPNRREADEEPEDDVLMQKAAGLLEVSALARTGMKYPASSDVKWDMTEDDVMLM